MIDCQHCNSETVEASILDLRRMDYVRLARFPLPHFCVLCRPLDPDMYGVGEHFDGARGQ
jgi:hypothetical protein